MVKSIDNDISSGLLFGLTLVMERVDEVLRNTPLSAKCVASRICKGCAGQRVGLGPPWLDGHLTRG